jgi:hypothetical protein
MTIPYADRYGGGFIDSPSQASPIDAQFLNAVEDALVALCGTSPAASKVPVWNNSTQQFEPGYPPGYELAYAEQTSNVTGITGTTFAGGTQIVSAGSVTFDGTAVWIEFSSEGVSNSAGGNKTFFDLSQDGTSIGTIAVKTHPSANNGGDQMPAGSLWNLVDYIPNVIGAPLRKRGGWGYGSDALGAGATPPRSRSPTSRPARSSS